MTDHRLPPDDFAMHDDAADAQLQRLLLEARDSYNVPPRMPSFDAMWAQVERDAFGDPGAGTPGVIPLEPRRRGWTRGLRNYGMWAGLAAGLVIGVLAGRGIAPDNTAPAATSVASRGDTAAAPEVDLATARYLGQTAALLVSLPAERQMDAAFADRARQLLNTTRLLLDAPVAQDADTRALLEDLELILTQIVGIQAGNRREELELINQALEQRGLLPRLHSAVNANPSNAAD